MIIAKSAKDLDKMRAVGELIAEVRESLRGMVKPGISTMDLNNAAEKMMRDAKILQIYEGTNQIQRDIIGLALNKEYAAAAKA